MEHVDMAHAKDPAILTGSVFRLIYRSRSKIASAAMDVELGNILRSARTNNAALGITGALLLYDNWFAQALEGEEAAVRSLYERIAGDSRHDAVELRAEGPVKSRVFSRWAMALVGEHGESDIPLMAAGEGTVQGQARKSSAEQEEILTIMRDATRGYGRGS